MTLFISLWSFTLNPNTSSVIKTIKRSFIFLFIIILTLPIKVFARNINHDTITGSIFGKVSFYESKNIKPVKIILIENNEIIKHDEEGYFYINNLKPGFYSLQIQVKSLIDHYYGKIEVLSNQIACVRTIYVDRASIEKIYWDLIEYQKKIEPIRYGKIEGYVVDGDDNPISNAYINYGGPLWEGKSNSKGYFRINKVVPGHYKGIGANANPWNWSHHEVEFDVYPGSVTKVKIKLFISPQIYEYN